MLTISSLLQYLNDSTLKNVHWAMCTGVFGKRDVGRIERELLDVLDFELSILEADILSHHDGLSAVALKSHSHRYTTTTTTHTHEHHSSHHMLLPELEPSSADSSSSSGSSSPHTPEAPEVVAFPSKGNAKHQIAVPPVPLSKPTISQSTFDLLQSLPIPAPQQAAPHRRASHKHYSTFSLKNQHASRYNSIEQAPRAQIMA
jgi:hypothetical protein